MTGGINFLYSIPGKFNAFKVGLSAGYNSYNLELKAHDTTSFHQSNNYYGSSIVDDTLTTKNSPDTNEFLSDVSDKSPEQREMLPESWPQF